MSNMEKSKAETLGKATYLIKHFIDEAYKSAHNGEKILNEIYEKINQKDNEGEKKPL